MKSLNPEAYILCSIDPITLGTLAVGAASSFAAGGASGALKAGGGETAAPSQTTAPATAPSEAASPQTKKPGKSSGMPSFIGGVGALPPASQNTGGKTLLGQ